MKYLAVFYLLTSVFSLSKDSIRTESFTPYKLHLEGSDQYISLVPISGGIYDMGSSNKANEGPIRKVEVSDFWMGQFELTWDQFEPFLYREIDKKGAKSGPIELAIDGVSGATMPYINFNKPGHPLICITQYAASQYCKWLTAKTGHFYRLPTEAEWEYACRADTKSDYSFGRGDIKQYGWFKENSNGEIKKGGLKQPNLWNLYDMHGNAAEWVLDSYKDNYGELSSNQISDPIYQKEELYPHVVRGGSWKDEKGQLRSSSRSFSKKEWKRQDPQFPKSLWWHTDALHVGFRIVRPKNVPSPEEMEKFWIKPIEEY